LGGGDVKKIFSALTRRPRPPKPWTESPPLDGSWKKGRKRRIDEG